MNMMNPDISLSNETAPVSEPERQYYYIEKAKTYVEALRERLGRPVTFCVTTFGCQMNARDSEKLRGILEQIGYIEAEEEEADFVIYNTCTVRENANTRVYGRLGQLKPRKPVSYTHLFDRISFIRGPLNRIISNLSVRGKVYWQQISSERFRDIFESG